MNIFWQNSFLAPFLVLAAVPLLLHLFARTKPQNYIFSSNMFLLSSAKQNSRIKRPFDILLLIIRTLLFLCIILMFMKPILFLFPDSAGFFEKKTVVLVVDSSASMGLIEAGRTRFAAACAEGSEILSGLSSGDKANIIWLQSKPVPEFSEPGSNIMYLQKQIRSKKVSNEAGNSGAALKLAVEMLKDLPGKLEICIISDFQKTQWVNYRNAIPENIKVAAIRIGKKNPGNLALSKVTISPTTLLQNMTADISCVINNYSPEARSCTLYFNTGQKRQNCSVMIPANGYSSPSFKLRLSNSGQVPLEFSISEDAFPEDNNITAVANIKGALKVAMIENSRYPALFWKKAIKPLSWVRFEELKKLKEAGTDDFDILMISGWRGDSPDILKKVIQLGKTVICSPAHNCPIASLYAAAGLENQASGKVFLEKSSKAYGMKVAKDNDPLFKLFSGGEFGDPAGGEFKARLNYGSLKSPMIEHIFEYNQGLPALSRISNKGTLYIWGIVLDPEYSHWAYRVQFLPFMAEILQHAGNSFDNKLIASNPGASLRLKLQNDISANNVKLRYLDKNMALKQVNISKEPYLISYPVENCGLYRWLYNNELISYQPVNFPTMESDLQQLESKEMNRFGVAMSSGLSISDYNNGVETWPYLLAVAVLLALMEGLVMWWSRRVG